MQIFWQQIQTPLSQKGKTFYGFFIEFPKCSWNLQHSGKKEEYPSLIFTEIIASERKCLLKRLKGLASGHHSVINMLTGSKHCWSQQGITIFLFFHEFEINWVGESLPFSHLKSSDCLLTRWLPMTSIPGAKCRLSNNKFKRFYLKKQKLFVDFISHLWNVHEI